MRTIGFERTTVRLVRDPIGTWTSVALVVGIGVVLAVGWFTQIAVPDRGPAEVGYISRIYDPPTRSVEVALDIGDGQIFATQAADPLAARGGVIRGGSEEEAYRYQRGAYGWIGWVASGGRADAVPWALVAVTVASVAALVGVVAEVLRRAGRPPWLACGLLVTPGVITNLLFIGPESLGTVLAVAGTVWWMRRPGAWGAVALFAGAGLCRETLFLVPAAIGAVEVVRRHRGLALRLAVAIGPYAAWVVYLRAHLGAWPTGSTGGRIGVVPFRGLVDEWSRWGPDDVAGVALMAVLGIGGLVVARTDILRAVLAAHLVLAACLGPAVWTEAAHSGRVLLPLAAFGLVSLATGGRGIEPPVDAAADLDGVGSRATVAV